MASQSRSGCPWKKSSVYFFHLKTSGFLRVLPTRDRIVRSNTWFIHSLLASAFAVYTAIATSFSNSLISFLKPCPR